MNPKVIGLILIVIGLGVALYFFNTGGVSKISSIVPQPPTSTLGVAVSTSIASIGSTSSPSQTAASSSENPIAKFFSILFAPFEAPMGVPTGPTIPGGTENNNGQSGYSNTNSIPPSEIPPGLTLAQLSPYFHAVRFSEASQYEISLSVPGTNGSVSPIDLTGWEIKTNRGGEYVPQVVNLYNPSAAPVESDLIVAPSQNDVVNFYSGSAPVNLRLNECMGYLNQTNQFNPPLPGYCPQINQSQISGFTGACQNYILSLGCQPVNFNSNQIPRNDYACQQYLEDNFTYDSCVHNHATDATFLSNEWHIWMGSSPLDPYHDNVELLDQNGLVVDTYSY